MSMASAGAFFDLMLTPSSVLRIVNILRLFATSRVSLICGSWSIPTGTTVGAGPYFSCGYKISATWVATLIAWASEVSGVNP